MNTHMHAKSQINELKDLTIHKVRDTVTYSMTI